MKKGILHYLRSIAQTVNPAGAQHDDGVLESLEAISGGIGSLGGVTFAQATLATINVVDNEEGVTQMTDAGPLVLTYPAPGNRGFVLVTISSPHATELAGKRIAAASPFGVATLRRAAGAGEEYNTLAVVAFADHQRSYRSVAGFANEAKPASKTTQPNQLTHYANDGYLLGWYSTDGTGIFSMGNAVWLEAAWVDGEKLKISLRAESSTTASLGGVLRLAY